MLERNPRKENQENKTKRIGTVAALFTALVIGGSFYAKSEGLSAEQNKDKTSVEKVADQSVDTEVELTSQISELFDSYAQNIIEFVGNVTEKVSGPLDSFSEDELEAKVREAQQNLEAEGSYEINDDTVAELSIGVGLERALKNLNQLTKFNGKHLELATFLSEKGHADVVLENLGNLNISLDEKIELIKSIIASEQLREKYVRNYMVDHVQMLTQQPEEIAIPEIKSLLQFFARTPGFDFGKFLDKLKGDLEDVREANVEDAKTAANIAFKAHSQLYKEYARDQEGATPEFVSTLDSIAEASMTANQNVERLQQGNGISIFIFDKMSEESRYDLGQTMVENGRVDDLIDVLGELNLSLEKHTELLDSIGNLDLEEGKKNRILKKYNKALDRIFKIKS